MSRQVISALLLDVDDTLVDTGAAMVAAGQAAAAQLWPQAGESAHHAFGVRFHDDPRGFFGRFAAGELSFAEMREARVVDLAASLSLPVIDDVTRRFEESYEPVFTASLRLFDDAWPLVDAASAAGILIGLLTNSSSVYTQQKLEMTGLAGVFAVVATRDTLGFGKPDARAFRHACELLGSVPAETIYVGDDVEIDAIGARDAGLAAALLLREASDSPGGEAARTRARAHGIPVVTSLSQVPALW